VPEDTTTELSFAVRNSGNTEVELNLTRLRRGLPILPHMMG